MPVRFDRILSLERCRAEPQALFVFGDNLKRLGKAGQAIIRDEPNAVGIPTKRSPSMTEDAFFQDCLLATFRGASDDAWIKLMEHLKAGGMVVLPFDGLGTGLAQLRHRAPRIWDEIQSEVKDLCRFGGVIE